MLSSGFIPPKDLRRKKTQPMKYDIQFPGIKPGYYQHIAREPNMNYSVQLAHWQQKKQAHDKETEDRTIKNNMKDITMTMYEKHAEKKQFQRMIRERVEQKFKAYEDTVEERRKKLLCEDEKQYYYETVRQAQQHDENKMEEMKRRAHLLKARREEERLKIVHDKRIEQYRDSCQQLRPYLEKKHLMETKYTQLQQIRENEARREAERELDRMWHELTMKEMRTKMEREEQDLLAQKRTQEDMMKIWENQIKGKELLQAEVEKVAHEDRIEMEKLSEQLRREEIEGLDAKRRKRDRTAKDLLDQIAEQEALLAHRRKQENAIDEAYCKLAELESKREKESIQDFTIQARKEAAMYRKHLQELEKEKKKEEGELLELLEIHRKEIERKQDEAKCKLIEAKRKLQETVLHDRAEQIAYKKQEAEQQLKLKEAENELLRMAFEQNERLQAESDRIEAEAVRQYRADLKKQIEYNNIVRERERQELERQLREGMKEEEKYREIVEDMIKQNMLSSQIHPFRRVLERHDCYCLSNNE